MKVHSSEERKAKVRTNAITISTAGVRFVRRRRSLEVTRHSSLLVFWDRVDVREAAARREARHGSLLVRQGGACEDCSADGGQVWASGGEVWREDLPVVQAAIVTVVAGWTCDAGVTRSDEDGDALEAKLHELVALALLV